jgi:hypothetical protein
MNRVRTAILIFGVIVIVLVQLVPRVDLPETAFNEVDSPIVEKARLTSPQVMTAAAVLVAQEGLHFSCPALAEELAPRQDWGDVQASSFYLPLRC